MHIVKQAGIVHLGLHIELVESEAFVGVGECAVSVEAVVGVDALIVLAVVKLISGERLSIGGLVVVLVVERDHASGRKAGE